MANYSLILDTKFKPFSYQEMLAPVAAATEAHQYLEDAYGELSTKASIWEELANEQTDPYAYNLYKRYADDLNNKLDQLLKEGLNVDSRRGMIDMKSRYNKEIAPIETAYKKREELAKEQRDALKANPTMLFQRKAKDISLDDFIKNPSLDYGESYSGALLTKQVSDVAATLAKEVNTPDGRRRIRKLLTDSGRWIPYQYEIALQKGFTKEEVDKAIRGDSDANPILTNIVNGVLDSSGISAWGDDDTYNQARYFANQGLYSAIGTTDYSNIVDTYNQNLALARAKNPSTRTGSEKLSMSDLGRFPINTVKIGLGDSKEGKKDDDIRAMFGTKRNTEGSITRAIFSKLPKEMKDKLSNQYMYRVTTNEIVPSPGSTTITQKAVSHVGTFFDENGKLLTKDEYNIINKNNPRHFDYDKTMKKLADYLEVPVSLVPNNFEEIEQAISSMEQGKGSGLLRGIELMLSPEDMDAAIGRIVSSTRNSSGELTVKKITGYENGEYKLGNRVDIDDIYDEEKGKAKGSPKFVVSDLSGKTNLLLISGGETYYVPTSDLGSIVDDTNIDTAEMMKVSKARDIKMKELQAFLDVTGIDETTFNALLNIDPTTETNPDLVLAHNKALELYTAIKKGDTALANLGASQISSLMTGLTGTYKPTEFKTSSQTGEYNPYLMEE